MIVDADRRRRIPSGMPTRLLMSSAAALFGVAGIATTFAPAEIAARQGLATTSSTVLLVQVTGALFLAFAMLDWMARGNVIGGIYSRPIAVANFLYFTIVTITLVKATPASAAGVGFLALHAIFALAFGAVVFGRTPVATRPASSAR